MSTAPASAAVSTGRDYAVLRWLVLASFIVILNETVLINAIPRLMTDFDISARTAQWLSTAFMLTLAVVIPVTGWFLQRVSTRQAFTIAMALFCTGTLLAAIAPTFSVLLAARIVQASGTAIMMPLLMTTLMTIVAEEDRGRIMGNVTLAMSVAPALGPAVSGLILHFASWRWMFGIVLPIAMAITGCSLRYLKDVTEPEAGSVDWLSVVLAALGFGPLVYGLSQIGGTQSNLVVAATIGLGLLMIVGFVVRQLALQRVDKPLLDLRTLRIPAFTLGLTLMALAFMAFLAALFLLPLYLQDVRGLSELQTGLLVGPGGLAMGLLGPTVGRIYDARGGRVLIIPGAFMVVVGVSLLTRVSVDTPFGYVLGAHLMMMLGLAALFTPLFTLSLGSLPEHLYSHGSSLLGSLQQIAGAIGTAVVVTVLASRTHQLTDAGRDAAHAAAGGFQWAFGFAAVTCLVVLALVGFMPGRVTGEGHGDSEAGAREELDVPEYETA